MSSKFTLIFFVFTTCFVLEICYLLKHYNNNNNNNDNIFINNNNNNNNKYNNIWYLFYKYITGTNDVQGSSDTASGVSAGETAGIYDTTITGTKYF